MDKYTQTDRKRREGSEQSRERRWRKTIYTRSSTCDTPYAYGLIKNAIEAAHRDAKGKIMNSRNISLGVEIANEDLEWRSTKRPGRTPNDRLSLGFSREIDSPSMYIYTHTMTSPHTARWNIGTAFYMQRSRWVVNLRRSCIRMHSRALRLRRQRW